MTSSWRPTSLVKASCAPTLAEHSPNRRDQFGRNDHDGLPLGVKRRFILGNRFVLGLLFVVFQDLADSFFITPARELLAVDFSLRGFLRLIFHRCLLRCWRRYAFRGLPV